MSFRAPPDVMAWLEEEAKRRGIGKNECMNAILRNARDGVAVVHTVTGPMETPVDRPWWLKGEPDDNDEE